MDKDQIFNTIKWIVIGIIVLLILRECKDVINSTTNSFKPKSSSDTITIVKSKTDTIWATDTVTILKPKNVFIPRIDTVWKPVYVDTTDFFRVYVSKDTFSTKDVDIYTEIHYQGLLRDIKPSYKLKVPLTIVETKTITNNITVHDTAFKPSLVQLQIGLIVSSNILGPEVGVSYKRHNFGVGYNIQNKFPTLRYSYTIFRK